MAKYETAPGAKYETPETGKAPKSAAPLRRHTSRLPTRGGYDWERIEAEYRAGSSTLTELSKKYGPGISTISERAARHGWSQDLSAAVRTVTNAKLIADAVRDKVLTGAVSTASEVVEAAAEVNRQVLVRHQGDIADTRSAAKMMLAEILQQSTEPELFRALVDKLNEDGDEQTRQQAQKALRDALSVHGRVASVQKIADTLTKLQVAERKARNMDDDGGKPPASGGSGLEEEDDDALISELRALREQRERLAKGLH